jgi:dipeptidyl-peptidase-4
LLIPPNCGDTEENLSLEEKLRRERQRLHAVGVTTYYWTSSPPQPLSGKASMPPPMRLMVPLQGNVFVQEGWDVSSLRMVYSRKGGGASADGPGAIDPQLSPDGSMVAFVRGGELCCCSVDAATGNQGAPVAQLTFGAQEGVTHGLADFVAQEEMDRYHGFWWSPDSKYIAYTRVDERHIPPYTIVHQGKPAADTEAQETHHYPFAGKRNPKVSLAVMEVDRAAVHSGQAVGMGRLGPVWMDLSGGMKNEVSSAAVTEDNEHHMETDGDGTDGKNEVGGEDIYLARVGWFPDGSVSAQVENRAQTRIQLLRLARETGECTVLLEDTSDSWINLHHLLRCLPEPVPSHGNSMGKAEDTGGSGASMDVSMSPAAGAKDNGTAKLQECAFSFLWASERTGYMKLYLYTYVAGASCADLVRPIGGGGDWVVESIVGIDQPKGLVYVTGTKDSACEKHMYALSLGEGSEEQQPLRLTEGSGIHNVKLDHGLTQFVDIYSCLEHPATMTIRSLPDVKILEEGGVSFLALEGPATSAGQELHSALDDRVSKLRDKLKAPDIISVRTRDGAVELYAAIYKPDTAAHGPGPYPTVVSVYGGPHVQRVNRSWNTTVDMRAQRLRDMGFLIVKCDNRGSFRRGLSFEAWIKNKMGTVEVTDQEDVVRHLIGKGLADPNRVGMYGWSYGGYMTAMCLCKAPGTFRVGVSGAPVTSWDGYDTHYTERYMGTPEENPEGYKDGSVLTHASKMQGKLLLVHGLIDENVHFKHTARLINALIAARKPYDLLLFPDERHSPRKLQDRIYMEQRISDYLVQFLVKEAPPQPSHL